MNDEITKENAELDALDALTDEPIFLHLGGKKYTIRRPNIKDYRRFKQFVKEQKQKNLQLESEGKPLLDKEDEGFLTGLFLISILMAPEHVVTPDQLEEMVLITDTPNILEVVNKLGFDKLQAQMKRIQDTTQPIGTDSMQMS